MQDAVLISEQQAIVAFERQRPRRRLLVGHADGAVEDRPALAVPGIEGVVVFADEVSEAPFVESRGVVAAEDVEPLALFLRHERIDRIGRGREVVGAVAAHLVKIDRDLREVLLMNRHAADRLRL